MGRSLLQRLFEVNVPLRPLDQLLCGPSNVYSTKQRERTVCRIHLFTHLQCTKPISSKEGLDTCPKKLACFCFFDEGGGGVTHECEWNVGDHGRYLDVFWFQVSLGATQPSELDRFLLSQEAGSPAGLAWISSQGSDPRPEARDAGDGHQSLAAELLSQLPSLQSNQNLDQGPVFANGPYSQEVLNTLQSLGSSDQNTASGQSAADVALQHPPEMSLQAAGTTDGHQDATQNTHHNAVHLDLPHLSRTNFPPSSPRLQFPSYPTNQFGPPPPKTREQILQERFFVSSNFQSVSAFLKI